MSEHVWAVFRGVEHAARVTRRFLESSANGGWQEVDETHPKVAAATKPQAPAPVEEPVEETPATGDDSEGEQA